MMKTKTPVLLALSAAATFSTAQLIPYFYSRPSPSPQRYSLAQDQSAMSSSSSSAMIADVIGTDKHINIFAGLTRDVYSVTSRLSDTNLNTTVLCPLNSAITGLPRKPWEDAEQYAEFGTNAYEGQQGSERAEENLKRFVEGHVVLNAPWKEGEKRQTMMGKGQEIWWEEGKDGVRKIMPGNVEVDSVTKRAANGEVWALKGVVDYAR